MSKLLNHPQVKPLLSDEHFSVDGTLIEAWASQKSFRPRDGSGDDDDGADFHGQSARTIPMPVPATPTAGFTAKPPGGRRSFAIWATPPWRTGMAWRWPAWSRTPMAPPSAEPRRSCVIEEVRHPAELGKRTCVHLPHQVHAMNLHRGFGDADIVGNLFI